MFYYEIYPHKFLVLNVLQLEKVVGEDSACVDWRRSFYLNLIAHTSYTVTVAICRYLSFDSLLKLIVFFLWH